VPRTGHHPLVVDAQIGRYTMKKVFIDGGSGINLIYVDMLRKMEIPHEKLPPSETLFVVEMT
jgi:hypothetical protein